MNGIGGRNMFRFLLGLVLGILILPLAVLLWFQFGKVPVAVADPQLPEEQLITAVPLNARIHREMIGTPPIQADEKTFAAGAQVYTDNCAVCHGFQGKPSEMGASMFPGASQLFQKHRNGDVVGVSDDPPGETYWKVHNGIRLTGMPAFKSQLSEAEMWQVSLLLANADKQMPPAIQSVLRGEGGAPEADTAPASNATKTAPDSATH
jgi:thiosulfate dehydrogenase